MIRMILVLAFRPLLKPMSVASHSDQKNGISTVPEKRYLPDLSLS